MDVETVSERMHREEVESLKKRIAALEAEKAERERQEPVGFQVRYKGERTWERR